MDESDAGETIHTTQYAGFGSFMGDMSVKQLVELASRASIEMVTPVDRDVFHLPQHTIDLLYPCGHSKSLHCENNYETTDSVYKPPIELLQTIHVPLIASTIHDVGNRTLFGHNCRDQFLIAFDEYTFLNHGAFGATMKCALEVSEQWRRHAEMQPLRFIDRELFPLLVYALQDMSYLLNVNPKDLVFIPNVTTAINCVFSSLANSDFFSPNSSVYMLDIAYGSVKKIASFYCNDNNTRLKIQETPLNVQSDDELVSLVEATLPENCKLAIFDHVASNTGLVLPVERLIHICHTRGIRVLIDGAHALGVFPDLNLLSLTPDYYTTNCHKWFCGTKGTALFFVRHDRQKEIIPPILSHGMDHGFHSGFLWDGCRDYAGVLALPWLRRLWISRFNGMEAVTSYCSHLLQDAIQLLTQAWNTTTAANPCMYKQMALIELPTLLCKQIRGEKESICSSNNAKSLQDYLYSHKIEVPVKCLFGRLFVRISAAIYNEISDYQRLADTILLLQNRT